jgi:hypothetical protein
MNTRALRRLVRWGGALALALVLAPGLVRAQDGQQEVGPPVTAPRTNDNKINEARPITDNPPAETTDLLPGVPATRHDPAPPGTRGVYVDGPAPASGAPRAVPGRRAQAAPGRAPAAGGGRRTAGQFIEGVVTEVSAPGKDFPEERVRIVVDPSQDWDSFVLNGPRGVAHHGARATTAGVNKDRATSDRNRQVANDQARPRALKSAHDANARRAEDRDARAGADADEPSSGQGTPLVVTKRSYIWTQARSPEGYDLPGVATLDSPDVQTSRTGSTLRPAAPAPGPQPASFAKIREGTFIVARYRPVGDHNEVLGLTLVELPLQTQRTAVPLRETQTPIRGVVPPAAATPPSGIPATPPRAGAPAARPGARPAGTAP